MDRGECGAIKKTDKAQFSVLKGTPWSVTSPAEQHSKVSNESKHGVVAKSIVFCSPLLKMNSTKKHEDSS